MKHKIISNKSKAKPLKLESSETNVEIIAMKSEFDLKKVKSEIIT